ncbi:uncharacterized protein LOC120631472 [Pararge aegeria]|uniref:Jg12602 protein n=2 Tax=Pararge aegeria TaxID=116150 RepID=A0A8S4S8J2_9NEOP|nr:uncharacterized protein LOC120631472 [Pararge aegeria]CAH2259008.1 jg12602 [Pararge aegeria aegeria]
MSDSDEGYSLLSAKSRLLDVFADLDDLELESIERWISSLSYKKDLEIKKSLINSDKLLKNIGDSIKKMIPFEAEMSTENIIPPSVGDQADCNKDNTCHVDEFLYDEKQVAELVKRGKLKRQYCLDCSSRNVQDLIFISHSLSRQALQYIFKVLLPNELEDKQILDIGSRLGSVLYAAYHLSNASRIVGIEMNKECCEVQEKIIGQYSMDLDRISVVNSDVLERHDIVECSDIIIMNVLDFFVDEEKHREMWYFFKKHFKKGSYLILNRTIAETLGCLGLFEEFMDWLSICKPNQMENEVFFDVEDYSELYLYSIN